MVLKKGADSESIRKLGEKIRERKKGKRMNTKEFVGILNLEADALDIQKRLRDEWQ
ncbi:MAG: hypothetical protein M9887_02215 [Chitinophagales bacterium]|nr:hypothetical protein [Chitinophagales bacterium]